MVEGKIREGCVDTVRHYLGRLTMYCNRYAKFLLDAAGSAIPPVVVLASRPVGSSDETQVCEFNMLLQSTPKINGQ